MSSITIRERDLDDVEDRRNAKRVKTGHTPDDTELAEAPAEDTAPKTKSTSMFFTEDLLPPSKSLLPSQPGGVGSNLRVSEPDVGILEYISHDVPRIDGIIKQRFTDFLVFEVDLQGQVVRLKSIAEPEEPPKPTEDAASKDKQSEDASSLPNAEQADGAAAGSEEKPETAPAEELTWDPTFEDKLSPFFSSTAIEELKVIYLQGPEPPFVSDSGWSGRQEGSTVVDEQEEAQQEAPTEPVEVEPKHDRNERGGRGRDKNKRGRGGRGNDRGGRKPKKEKRPDNRRVLSNAIASKQDRTALHEIIRSLFKGKMESEVDTNDAGKEEGQRIVIKWSRSKGGNVKRGKDFATAQGGRGNAFPYIHFTMQKTNRDTQDALSHLARQLHVNVKDLCVSGTKDKRGVTTQRVSLKRNGKILQDVWKVVNGITGRRTIEQALTERGERGIRIGDLAYRKGFLELGMLKGNAFVITLRNVKADSLETIDRAMTSLKEDGFINYYGMQRFGTSSIPTHSIGLALLRSDWTGAVSLILRPRPGEYPEADAARRAWLDDRDIDRALALMPRRVVAERCILENYHKQGGEDRNALGAISCVPKNLRLMYIHAYQSYVWNAIVSERIRLYGRKPIVGDLVFDNSTGEDIEEAPATADADAGLGSEALAEEPVVVEEDRPNKKGRKGYQPPRVKVLGPEDLDKYSIFDVIMPLPGTDVAYPEGPLGEKYKEFLRLDGLDPDNWQRKQKDYTLGGSYRKILHLPKEISWTTMRYTDPDVSLAQSDEDHILGFDTPVTEQDGPFLALQIQMQLGTAAYATMALREVTKTDTSSHHQTTLTLASDDQTFKGSA